MARRYSYTYDPKTKKWILNSETYVEDSEITPTNSTDSGTDYFNDNESDGTLSSTSTDSDSSVGVVEKQYNQIQLNTLSGQLAYIPNEKTIKLKAGDTVLLTGLGKYLSGRYYVKEITRTVNGNGYSHSATVIRTDFGDKLKLETNKDSGFSYNGDIFTEKETKRVYSSVPTAIYEPQRIHTVTTGETLWSIAKDYYGDGSKTNLIFDAITGARASNIKVGQKLVII